MWLLRVIHSANPAGGGPIEGIRQISPCLRDLGHQTTLACLDHPPEQWLTTFDFPVVALGPALGRYGYTPRLRRWLQQHLDGFDAIIVHGIWQFHSLCVWRLLGKNQVPFYVFPHGMLDPWFKHRYPWKHLKKWLYWPWAEYRVLRDARAVLFTSEEERRRARQSFFLYRCHELVVNYGVTGPPSNSEPLRAIFLGRFPHLRGKRLVLFLGRIHEKKGCDLLLNAFHTVMRADGSGANGSAFHLVMAGPDPCGWQAELIALAERLGLAHDLTWTGMLAGDLKWGAFAAAEVFALPSHQENFGISVAEALACGVPVLVSDQVNIWREIEDDAAGFVAPDTQAGTEQLFHRWLELTPEQRDKMSLQATRCFRQRFEATRAAASLIAVLDPGLPGSA